MITGLLLLALTGAHAAPAAEAPDAPPPAEAPPTGTTPADADPCQAQPPDRDAPYEQELDRAVGLYRQGCHAWALDLLRDLDVRRRLADTDPALAIKQRKYLGEVLLVLGRRQEAEDTFRLLLAEHPKTEMSLLRHAPEAVNLFERVQASQVLRPPDPDDVQIPRRKAYTYIPFGVAHFSAGDTRRGVAYGTVQGLFYGAALTTFFLLPTGPAGTRSPDTLSRDRTLRSINFAANAGFILTYTFSQLDARQRWRAKYAPAEQARIGIGVSPKGVVLNGSW